MLMLRAAPVRDSILDRTGPITPPSSAAGSVVLPEKAAGLAGTLRREVLCVAFADVEGFSALMHADEEGTFQKWSGLRDEVVLPHLDAHGGRLVKLTGDGILATFPQALSGARWARDVQRRARHRRQGLALRIALNLCPVFHDRGDLAGDGVNIAARLQEQIGRGGIIVTDAVHAQIAAEPEMELRPIGPLRLRRIRSPIVAYELVTDGRPVVSKAPSDPEHPSIAVLPFQNLGENTEDDYFAAGLVEDIVGSLSRLRELTVISRSSTLAFARQVADPSAVGSVLGVRYVISGTLRRAEGRLRISTQLTDTDSGEQVFAERRDFAESDTFRIQDEIVALTISRLMPGLRAAERRRALRKWPGSFTAFDFYLRGLDQIGSLDQAQFEEAYKHLNSAIERDPGFATPLAWSARWHTLRVGQGWSEDPRRDAEQAAERAGRAIQLDAQNPLALAVYGHVQSYLFGDFDVAIDYLDRARDIDPNNSVAWLLSSITLGSLGRATEALEAAERALRLSPFDQNLFNYYAFLGTAHYNAGNYDAAIRWLSRSLAENDRYTSALRTLTVALVAAGKIGRAREIASDLMRRQPDFRLEEYRRSHRLYADPERSQIFRDRLRQAGVPD